MASSPLDIDKPTLAQSVADDLNIAPNTAQPNINQVNKNQANKNQTDNNQVTFDLFAFFDGYTKAFGFFESRFGRKIRHFKVDIHGSIENHCLTLDEHFLFDDKKKDQRVWKIQQISPSRFLGHADDVIGVAEGVLHNNKLDWRYDLNMKVSNTAIRVHFKDRMILSEDQVMINSAVISKWGIIVGRISLIFFKNGSLNASASNDNFKKAI